MQLTHYETGHTIEVPGSRLREVQASRFGGTKLACSQYESDAGPSRWQVSMFWQRPVLHVRESREEVVAQYLAGQ